MRLAPRPLALGLLALALPAATPAQSLYAPTGRVTARIGLGAGSARPPLPFDHGGEPWLMDGAFASADVSVPLGRAADVALSYSVQDGEEGAFRFGYRLPLGHSGFVVRPGLGLAYGRGAVETWGSTTVDGEPAYTSGHATAHVARLEASVGVGRYVRVAPGLGVQPTAEVGMFVQTRFARVGGQQEIGGLHLPAGSYFRLRLPTFVRLTRSVWLDLTPGWSFLRGDEVGSPAPYRYRWTSPTFGLGLRYRF